MSDDRKARHAIGNLMAERDACKRQLRSASALIRELVAGRPEAVGRAISWCDMIERVIVVND